ncbi:MAG: TrkH family potassium uptake protein, partial [Burkholderiales bacterium]|nr:TrkH family potassium uptake protein [Burkholderiales bacterium]
MYRTLPVINLLGQLIVLFSLTMVVPLMYSLITRDAALYAYDKAILVTVVSGFVMALVSRKHKR